MTMNPLIKGIRMDNATCATENGAVALNSTLNACLDAFGLLGAMKTRDAEDIVDVFAKAFAEDRRVAMRMLFYMRDIRGGQGTRRVFRVIVTWLGNNYTDYVLNNLPNFLKFGRGDDLLCLLDTKCKDGVCNFIQSQLRADESAMLAQKPCSLLAKWLPSENGSSQDNRRLARMLILSMHTTPRRYRQRLSALRKYIRIVERNMSAQQWSDIDYETVPSKAASNYRQAFIKHDAARYTQYLTDLAAGKAKVNAGALYPMDIVKNAIMNRHSEFDDMLLNAQWENLPNYVSDEDEHALAMVDTSASMLGDPYFVATSLGIYFAQRSNGPFHNTYMTFAERPSLMQLNGQTLTEQLQNMPCINAGNTDLEAAFDLILNTGITYHVAEKDMPKKLYIISDMQFDAARGTGPMWSTRRRRCPPKPFMQTMREKYEAAGYQMPTIIYWNVRSSECGMFQATFEDENCAMVSGYSPSLFKAVMEGTTYEEVVQDDGTVQTRATVNPMDVMYAAINNERYDSVWCG